MTTTDDGSGAKECGGRPDVDAAVYKTLLESTKAIPWKIDWATKTFAYIGPQIETLLGWSPDSWRTAQDWVDRMHPEDRDRVFAYCVAQSLAGLDHEADYRALTTSGTYVWLRDVVHVVRSEAGEVESLIGFMFDISERKRTEQQLLELQRDLEELSFKDGLTGLANRRRFDALVEAEWLLARKNERPLSLLMIDIDFFKQYNDRYGHVRGDDCLKRVAHALSERATRPRDFVARYGGEEFALVLPETDAQGANRVAARCREALVETAIPHETSSVSPSVTVSIGVGTTIPSPREPLVSFIDAVDKRLYQAKQRGRNAIVGSTQQ